MADKKRKTAGKINNRRAEVKVKKDYFYPLIAFVPLLFGLIPIINLLVLPLSFFFAIKAIKLAKMDPEKYGGRGIAVFAIVAASILAIACIYGLIVSIKGRG